MFQRFRVNLDFNFGRREDKHHTLVGFIQRTTNLMPLPGLIAYIEAERARLRLRPQAEVVSSLEPGIIDFTRPVQPILRGFEQPVFEATATEPVLVCGPPGPTPAQPCAFKDVEPTQPPYSPSSEGDEESWCQSQSDASGSDFGPRNLEPTIPVPKSSQSESPSNLPRSIRFEMRRAFIAMHRILRANPRDGHGASW